MTCNCQNWDDPNPCPKHGMEKIRQPETVEHHCIVVKVFRKLENKKWFYSITRDGVHEFTSPEYITKKEATPI